MKSIRITLTLPACVVLLALMGVAAFLGAAYRPSLPDPTVVAIVNRTRVLEGLRETATERARLGQVAETLQAGQEQRQTEAQSLRDQIEATDSEADRNRMLREFELKSLELREYTQYANDKMDVETALLLQSLYRSMSQAIALMAVAEGYEIVLVDDSKAPFAPPNPNLRISREDQIKQQIRERRIMYAGETVDITEALIVRMNNAYDAG